MILVHQMTKFGSQIFFNIEGNNFVKVIILMFVTHYVSWQLTDTRLQTFYQFNTLMDEP